MGVDRFPRPCPVITTGSMREMGQQGAPAFDPRLLASLWIYSYSKGISSSREIERLSAYDPAYQWLTGMRPVNYHTLADFRTAHHDSLHMLFVEVLVPCLPRKDL